MLLLGVSIYRISNELRSTCVTSPTSMAKSNYCNVSANTGEGRENTHQLTRQPHILLAQRNLEKERGRKRERESIGERKTKEKERKNELLRCGNRKSDESIYV